MDLVIGTRSNPVAVDRLVRELRAIPLTYATLYVGYPILSTADQSISLDAILTSVECGVTIFDLTSHAGDFDWQQTEERQAEIEIALKSKLIKHKDLTYKRNLDTPINVITYLPKNTHIDSAHGLIVATEGQLTEVLGTLEGMDPKYVRPLNAAIQQIATIKPTNKRLNVKHEDSRGGKLRIIEREIANLDRWQKKGAIECPDGPQRIRGLAGSGKTVVLALKAAYLHAQHPDWHIGVGFQTRSLYGQFSDLIRRFTYEHLGDEPNWDKLRVLHAWGSTRDPGIYSLIAKANGITYHDYSYGRLKYSTSAAFEGVCREALEELRGRDRQPVFDALLIDEAQDFGPNFFRLAYSSVTEPRRFVFAYDELQSLKETSLPGLSVLFGTDQKGAPRVKLRNLDGQPQQDIILPVCYRNTAWSLAMAHALGFGVYRAEGLIQMFDEPSLWSDIGYEVTAGELVPGKSATLARRVDATPEFFSRLLSPDDAIQLHTFNNNDKQAEWVAQQIQSNLKNDELEPSDILVIFANPISVPADAGPLIAKLQSRGIPSHIAGVTRSQDEFFVPNSVVVSGIFRAKGNEAPMVYVMGADYCYEGNSLIRRRNILFTAITRSRAWVRVCGVGQSMDRLRDECELVKRNNYKLSFTVLSPEDLARIRRIHRDKTEDEIQRIENSKKSLEDIINLLERDEIALEDLPASTRQKLTRLLGGE